MTFVELVAVIAIIVGCIILFNFNTDDTVSTLYKILIDGVVLALVLTNIDTIKECFGVKGGQSINAVHYSVSNNDLFLNNTAAIAEMKEQLQKEKNPEERSKLAEDIVVREKALAAFTDAIKPSKLKSKFFNFFKKKQPVDSNMYGHFPDDGHVYGDF